MFKIGDKIKVVSEYSSSFGRIGIISEIHGLTRPYIIAIDSVQYKFSAYADQIELIENKWNPLNYKSHFKPIKLP